MIKRILIIDDDPDVLFLLTSCLTELGPNYEVEACGSGPQALAAGRIRAFDLVISDYEMPGLDGLEVARALAERQPGMKVILMSGYVQAMAAPDTAECRVSGFMGKPFTMDEVLAEVLAALES